jgi:hypothetical protein
MKTKQFGKKLSLNKKTIAHLDDAKMSNVQGGIDTSPTAYGATCCSTLSNGPFCFSIFSRCCIEC